MRSGRSVLAVTRKVSRGCVALGVVALASPSRAETAAAVQLAPAPVGDSAFSVNSADVRGHARLRAGVLLDYARGPLRVRASSQHRETIVAEQLVLHAQASYALSYRWLLGLEAPVALLGEGSALPQENLPAPNAPGLGAPRLSLRGKVLGPAGDGAHLSLVLRLGTPWGARRSYATDQRWHVHGAAVVGGRAPRFTWSFEAGYLHRAAERLGSFLPLRSASAVTFGASAKWLFLPSAHVELGPEIVGSLAVGDGASWLDPRSTVVQTLIGGRYRYGGGPFYVGAAWGPALGQAPGAADYRLLIALGWSVEVEPPPPDADDDGVPDASDACVDLHGSRSADPLMNGCPEVPRDGDGDAIPDTFDACPRVPGEPTGIRATHGCPPPATPPPAAAPAPPSAPQVTVEPDAIAISEQVQFRTGTAEIEPASEPLLRAVAAILQEHGEILRVEVAGHTDDTGSAALNARLAEERAAAVRLALIRLGVAEDRLVSHGYGARQPIAPNTDEAGRARNRRVEFRILERNEPRRRPGVEYEGQP